MARRRRRSALREAVVAGAGAGVGESKREESVMLGNVVFGVENSKAIMCDAPHVFERLGLKPNWRIRPAR